MQSATLPLQTKAVQENRLYTFSRGPGESLGRTSHCDDEVEEMRKMKLVEPALSHLEADERISTW